MAETAAQVASRGEPVGYERGRVRPRSMHMQTEQARDGKPASCIDGDDITRNPTPTFRANPGNSTRLDQERTLRAKPTTSEIEHSHSADKQWRWDGAG